MKYQHVFNEVFQKPWAILPDKFHTITALIAMRASGEKLTQEEIQLRLAPQTSHASRVSGPAGKQFGAVAVIPIYGVISQKISLMSQISGGTTVQGLTKAFRAAMADPAVKAIVFDVDSPGGSVEGVPELAAEILSARGQGKKITASVNPMCASAAYWLASAADEIVITPSGQCGSIGVFCEHNDVSQALEKEGVKVSLIKAGKFKAEGNPYEPLSDAARAAMQGQVDAFYEMFVKAVASGRRVSQSSVKSGFGQGRMVLAADAVTEGMADRVATLDQVIGKLSGGAAPRRMSAALSAALVAGDYNGGCQCLGDGQACDSCSAGNCGACSTSDCSDEACAENGCPFQKDDDQYPDNLDGNSAVAAETIAPAPAAAEVPELIPPAKSLAMREHELDLIEHS
jgi:signal peptide peptidase SppA